LCSWKQNDNTSESNFHLERSFGQGKKLSVSWGPALVLLKLIVLLLLLLLLLLMLLLLLLLLLLLMLCPIHYLKIKPTYSELRTPVSF
jgi:hypothetical protein